MESMRYEPGLISLTGEVIYESVGRDLHKKALKELAYRAIYRCLGELLLPLDWASFLVIFSPGQGYDEIRCQVDVETNTGHAGFAIGFGLRPSHAFHDAIERMQWHEKNAPIRLTG